MIHGRASRLQTAEVTILSGQTVSTVARSLGGSLVAVQTPSALTGTAFTVQASGDGETFDVVRTASGDMSIAVAASRYVLLSTPVKAAAVRLVSNAGSGEGATRVIRVIFDLEGA